MYICIFGGTTEGRLLAEFLSQNEIEADLYVATEYGEQFVKNLNNINLHQKRLDEKDMIDLFTSKKYSFVVDATHPFAKIVSQNIYSSASASDLKYIRVIRESFKNNNCLYFDELFSIVDYLNKNEGVVFLTTGSKDLDKFTYVNNYPQRMYVRILPMEDSLKKAIDLGFLNKNIICMQGPFSEELNIAIINSMSAKYVVTKESASSGGFVQKVEACLKTGAECLVVKKPDEEGITLNQLKDYIKRGIVK